MMCGRKTLTRDIQSIIEELSIDEWNGKNFQPNYNITPSQNSPVLIEENNSRVVKSMQWGLVPQWAKQKSIGAKMINARAETILEKPSYQNLILQNRCVIIADGYYEWQRNNNSSSQPHYIFHPEKKLLPMAGLWTSWTSSINQIINSYTVITTTAKLSIAHIHQRMPVILNPFSIDEWIHCDATNLNQTMKNLGPYAKPLSFHPVSTLVNSPKNNSPRCIRSSEDTLTLGLF